MHIRIICPGKTKDNYLNDGIKEYLKRLSAWVKVEFVQIADVKLSNSNTVALVKSKEAEIIKKHLNPRNFTIALDEVGKNISTVDLSKKIEMQMGDKNIDFIIGGVYGLDKSIREQANFVLSFSKMTFTHQMIRLILVEQLYRCFAVIKNKKYHY